MVMVALPFSTLTSLFSTTPTLHCHIPLSLASMLVILIPQSTSLSLAKCSSLPPSALRLDSRGYCSPYGVVQLHEWILVEA